MIEKLLSKKTMLLTQPVCKNNNNQQIRDQAGDEL